WKEYNAEGLMTSLGTRTGVTGKLVYQDNKLTGVLDRDDARVLWYEYQGDLISAVYDAENRRVDYSYINGLLASVTDVRNTTTGYQYDGQGRIVKIVDPLNREINITYDDYENVTSVINSEGIGYFFKYDYFEGTKETYVQMTGPSGMVKEVWYDRNGETKQVDVNGRTIQKVAQDGRTLIITDEKGHITRKEYDEWDNLVKVIYPDNSQITYEYERTFNKRIQATDERGIITTFEYDAQGNMTKKTEAAGTDEQRITEYTYDDDSNLLTVKRVGDANTGQIVTIMEYDTNGNPISVTDPENNITQFTSHDIMGNVLSRIDPRGKEWTYTYDNAGNLKTITDPLTFVTEIFYNKVGNRVKELDPELKETSYEYNDHDNMIKRTDPSGNETLFEYNHDNKLIKQTDSEAKEINYVYDNEARFIKTIDGNGNKIAVEYDDSTGSGCSSCSGGTRDQPKRITYPTFEKEFSYDLRNRKTEEKDILSETEEYPTQFGYDQFGNLISRKDKESKTTGYEYDPLNRLKKVTDSMSQDTLYVYDNRDNLIKLTDANNQATCFEYDKNNRLIKETRPMGKETTYQYDAAGNLTRKIDAKNQKTEYIYDDAGRLEDVKYYASASDTTPEKTVSFTYDKVGNLKSYDDGTTSASYDYDDNYRKITETVDYGTFLLATNYTYYKNGLKKTFTGPDNITYEYAYDNNNQLSAIQIPNIGAITNNSYNWIRPESMTLPAGATKDFTYDSLMRLKSITTKDPGQNNLIDYQYTYDKMDNITAKETEHGDYQYNYDDLYRLTTTDNPDFDDEAFTYDPVGNRLTSSDTTGDWDYNLNNELLGYDNVSFEYDANCNMIQKNVGGAVAFNFVYNIENRLTEVRDSSDDLIATYYYDPFGRRLWKEVYGGRTYFHYSDEGLVGEYDANGDVIRTYGYKPYSLWGTDPLFLKSGTEYYFYHNDLLGTPQKMTAVNGAVVWSAKYDSFGKASVDGASAIANDLRFPGQYFDDETGLHYNWHRYYDPSTGRYMTPDSIGLDGGINLYSYTSQNPTNLTDPEGLWVPQAIGAFIGGSTNAIANYDAYQAGKISGLDYSKSIIFGAGIGALSSFAPGVWGGAFTGGLGSSANNLYNQSISSDCIDQSKIKDALVKGFASGFAGSLGSKIGKNIIDPIRNVKQTIPNVRQYDITGKGSPAANYGTAGGLIGIFVGTIFSN
ncbi:MAG: RHS repeat-associated core domain-containing protein, partial [Bacteroidota bacterium]|nr:RHS repeat-associated core domain-containing protein [Bacteroidota bacterium]